MARWGVVEGPLSGPRGPVRHFVIGGRRGRLVEFDRRRAHGHRAELQSSAPCHTARGPTRVLHHAITCPVLHIVVEPLFLHRHVVHPAK
ncbi:hypothetical protein OOK58_48705 [Streptomyces sp. NBC_01728]|uniref:hypothetical protein n=1 Tax=unclassified Streptomyces TaxID=2593676 RepID=UPI002256AA39|nr:MULTISPECIES: hypothetical protein [unclassified Streptomyces]MCX4459729.1 hypothetical protein [Streptomyces sp. NBC_01719]MCX4499087.1 hypothetical protein [Streptomyces sp. NBC_01728]